MTIAEPVGPRPVVAFDHRSPEFKERNYEIFREMRERCPIAWSEAWGGFWFLTDYDSVFDVARQTEIFSMQPERRVPLPPYKAHFLPMDSDPPQLQQYRKMLLPWYTPKAAEADEARLREIATELTDGFIERGHADVIAELTTPLPARWILATLGLDEQRWPDYVHWVHTIVHERSHNPELATQAVQELFGELAAVVAQRRAAGLGEDMLSGILSGEVDGEPLTDEQILNCVFLQIVGGMDTTSGLTGNALLRLEEQPELRKRLLAEPELLEHATEEFLRHDTPVQGGGNARLVTEDVVFHGQQLRAGDRIVPMYGAANRDPDVFERPDEIDFDRTNIRHMAFGIGQHRCLGSNHARVMFRVMVGEILRRMPDFRIEGEVRRFDDAGDIYAVRSLPLSFTPGPRVITAEGSV
jgi:cytochrome P450